MGASISPVKVIRSESGRSPWTISNGSTFTITVFMLTLILFVPCRKQEIPLDTRPDMCHNIPMFRINYFITESLLDRMKLAKIKTGLPMAEFLRRALDAALKKVGL